MQVDRYFNPKHCARRVQVRTEYRKEHVVKVNCVNIKRWYSRVLLLSSEFYSQRFSLQCTCFVQHNKKRREEEQLQCFLKQAEYPACTKNRILIVAKAFQSLLCTPLSPLAIEKELPINISTNPCFCQMKLLMNHLHLSAFLKARKRR